MSQIAVARALSDELTWKILDSLIGKKMSAKQIQKSLHAPASSVSRSLEKLIEAGMITAGDSAPSSRKNARTYALTGVAKNVGFPPRNYLYLSESIINSLRESLGEDGARTLLRDIGIRLGENVGRTLASRTKSTKWAPSTYANLLVSSFLGEMGFKPEVVKVGRESVLYQEQNCLFEDLAIKYPGLVCDVLDEAVHEGVDKMSNTQTSRLKCKGHGDPVCEYLVKWRTTTQEKR
jgi:predicted ArsR family transcriptional regulator